MWADSHCHLHDERVDTDNAVGHARASGVRRMISVGCDLPTSSAAIADAARFHDVWATVGLHPHEAKEGLDWIEPLLTAPRVVAVGECGLDYHYDHSPRDIQREAFASQVRLAHAHSLPLVIHTRSAWDDTFAILAAEGTPATTIFHCFSGGASEAERCLALPATVYLSFSGIVTFPSATDLQAAAAITPLDRLLVETDSPYLAPVPHRGKRNEPAFVIHVGSFVAGLRCVPVSEIERSTWTATASAFRLPA